MEELKNSKINTVKWIFIIISIIHILYVSAAMRGMYEDGAFFMIDLLNKFSNNIYSFTIDAEHPRFFIMGLMQLPLFIVHWFFGISSKTFYMVFYTFVQFSLPLLALWWNYSLTKRTGRTDIFFWSLFNYCAILITFSIFSLVETIIGATFHFILWNYMAAKIEYTKKDIAAILFLIIMMFGTYEYVVILGLIFFIASVIYSLKEEDVKKSFIKAMIGFGALCASIYNFIYMLRVPGEDGEVMRFFKEMYDYLPHIWELNSSVSIITIILLILYMFKKDRIKNTELGIICIIYIIAFIRLMSMPLVSVYPMWEQHLRTVPCYALPLIFLIILINSLIKKENSNIKISNLICIVLICGITQTCWQMVNTYYWNKNIEYMKQELASVDDLLYIPTEHEEISSFHNEHLRRYIWHGIFAATSILFSDSYEQKTLLVNYDERQDEGNGNFRNLLYVFPDETNQMMIPFGAMINIKNKYWDLTDCAAALDKYNKEHNIQTDR